MISKLPLPFAIALALVMAITAAAQTPAPQPHATPASQPPAAVPQRSNDAQIRAVLDRQVVDWNRGDTEGFLLGYDPKVIFVGEKITRGLDEVRVRYQTHYPTRASMGKLTFSDLEIRTIDATHALVIGRWRLERAQEGGGDTGGVFTLLFEKSAKGWRIVVDHTS